MHSGHQYFMVAADQVYVAENAHTGSKLMPISVKTETVEVRKLLQLPGNWNPIFYPPASHFIGRGTFRGQKTEIQKSTIIYCYIYIYVILKQLVNVMP
jgi:hypothetical protein